MKLNVKFFIISATYLVVLVIFGIILNNQLNHLFELSVVSKDEPVFTTSESLESSRDLLRLKDYIIQLRHAESLAEKNAYMKEMNELSSRIEQALREIKPRLNKKEARMILDQALLSLQDLKPKLEVFFNLLLNNASYENIHTHIEINREHINKIVRDLDKIVAFAKKNNVELFAKTVSNYRKTQLIIFSAGAFIILFFLMLCYLASINLIRPVSYLRRKLKNILNTKPIELDIEINKRKTRGLGQDVQNVLNAVKNEVDSIRNAIKDLENKYQKFDDLFFEVTENIKTLISNLREKYIEKRSASILKKANLHQTTDCLQQIQTNMLVITQMLKGNELTKKLFKQDNDDQINVIASYLTSTNELLNTLVKNLKERSLAPNDKERTLSDITEKNLTDMARKIDDLVLLFGNLREARQEALFTLKNIK